MTGSDKKKQMISRKERPSPSGHFKPNIFLNSWSISAVVFPSMYLPVKRAYSFTGDLKIYETCPRHYQFFRKYDFTPEARG